MKNKIRAFLLCAAILSIPASSEAHPIGAMGWGMLHHHVVNYGPVKTGFIYLPVAVVGGFFLLNLPNMIAWDNAKDAGTTKQFQQAERFPQQWFDQLPGGTPGRLNPVQ